jgi:hypothetical protein
MFYLSGAARFQPKLPKIFSRIFMYNSIEDLNDVGLLYLARHRKQRWLSFHNNHPIAEKIARFSNLFATPADVKTFLIENYLQLPDHHGALARAITSFIHRNLGKFSESVNNRKIPAKILIRSLTPATLKIIGEEYLRCHPKRSLLHKNQWLANCLINLCHPDKKNYLVQPDPYEMWDLVFSVYGRMSKSEGKLAEMLDKLIQQSFESVIIITKVIAAGGGARRLTAGEISRDLRAQTHDELKKAAPYRELRKFS